ncbi:eukaryotic translation initiation factor 2D [Amyelois transitella]|uniref:eukaryotic translation initiation factor 2D n=1 Tax=Amyelois transitella TaxID=680683 RepID=UPI0029905D60|nr:eukaryotic translation initiation factor 2D [Amyelois transitella]
MFSKAYKLKSNSTLKNSEKKHLVLRIQDEFSNVSEEKVKELVPVKSSTICMKLTLHSGDTVGVYAVDGIPVLIETAEQLVPTVCALWKVPDMVPMMTVHSPVVPKVLGGASVYLPGVTLPAGGLGFPQFRAGAIVAANTTDNAAAAVVGRAVMSSGDMLLRAAGTCLEAIQVIGDQLCKDPKLGKVERPKLGLPVYGDGSPAVDLAADINQLTIREEWPTLGKAPAPAPATPVHNEPKIITEALTPQSEDTAQVDDSVDDTMVTDSSHIEEDIPSDMDGLLLWCLLVFLKLEGRTLQLPLKTNILYKNHLMPLCPPGRTLDVKKSTYKKMGKFMDAMQEEGLVEVRELEKGVSAVVAANLAHPRLRRVRPPAPPAPAAGGGGAAGGAGEEYAPPAVREVHCVTAAVGPVLPDYKKGTPLSSATVRSTLTEYVKSRELNSKQSKGAVVLDAALAKILGKQEQVSVKWDELMSGVLSRMTAATEMSFADGTSSLVKAKLEPITMTIANRSGNKKVTLVSNLESFGFCLPSLAAACQRGAAAACGVTRAPGARRDQLMLQGDQTHFIAKLLCETYGLPKKFVEGADKALKKKK